MSFIGTRCPLLEKPCGENKTPSVSVAPMACNRLVTITDM
jgi:hypothetical protein